MKYFRNFHWSSIELPEISKVTWRFCYPYLSGLVHRLLHWHEVLFDPSRTVCAYIMAHTLHAFLIVADRDMFALFAFNDKYLLIICCFRCCMRQLFYFLWQSQPRWWEHTLCAVFLTYCGYISTKPLDKSVSTGPYHTIRFYHEMILAVRIKWFETELHFFISSYMTDCGIFVCGILFNNQIYLRIKFGYGTCR